jgi:hypothetical protein
MNLRIFRVIWVTFLAILIVYFSWQAIVPSGKISYTSDFSKDSYFIDPLLPAERIRNHREIIDEPVYIGVFTTRSFDKAIVTLNFSAPSPALQVGAERDKALWLYDFKTVAANSLSARLEFDLKEIKRKKGKYTFMISAPDISKAGKTLIIKDLKIEFVGATLPYMLTQRF